MDKKDIKSVINHILENGGALWMCYENNQGISSNRVVEPLSWENENLFRAYCYLRQEERKFRVEKIQVWQAFPTPEGALALHGDLPEAPPEPPTAFPVPLPVHPEPPESTHGTVSASSFSKIETPEYWSRLVTYYAECLIRENRQQYIIKPENLRTFPSASEDIERFMLGKIQLVFKKGNSSHPDAVYRFIDSNRKQPDKQLCLGYPFLVANQNEIAPLIYTPVEITPNHDNFTLRSEGFEVSYAALKSLKLTEEEIDEFLEACTSVEPEEHDTTIQAMEKLLFEKISEAYQTKLPRVKGQFKAGTIFDGPALFWVASNTATINLIRELQDLAEQSYWESAPDSLKQLLNILPDHEYPEFKDWDQDHGIFVTPVNQQQRRAIQSVRNEPIVVVTGPPGTGKSQLVLNLIAEAFLKGERVLFASRNNRAVDVVMNRLQIELQFQGAVRTGSKPNREKAAIRMKAALDKIGTQGNKKNLKAIQDQYYGSRQAAIEAQKQLDRVRDLTGLLLSHSQERDQYLNFLPEDIRKPAEDTVPDYQASEVESIQSTLSSLLEHVLKIKDEKKQLESKLLQIEKDGGVNYALITEIYHLQDQWGSFGGGFIRAQRYETIESAIQHLEDWLYFIDWMEIKNQSVLISEKIKTLTQELNEKRKEIPLDLSTKDEIIANQFSKEEIKKYLSRSKTLENRISNIASGTISIWERLLNWITGGALLRKEIQSLELLHNSIGLPVSDLNSLGAEGCAVLAGELHGLLSAAKLVKDLTSARSKAEEISKSLQEVGELLTPSIREDLKKFSRFDFDNSNLSAGLFEILDQFKALQNDANGLIDKINNKLDGNEDQLSMLAEFKNSYADVEKSLMLLDIPTAPDVIIQHLTIWHNLVTFWSADAIYKETRASLEKLPSEENALVNLKNSQDKMLQLSGEILRATWMERAQEASNEVLQKVHDYVTAVEELTKDYNPDTYKYYKSIEKTNMRAAVQIFPVWATTNLTAKTNFPLVDGFFDLVIIDEASQCDFPSALPLLFRGRRMVIIGDPNQLRHVATLSRDADQELAYRYGVGIEAYSYNARSLYDIAERSCGSHPGALLLNEHYRSDARIINFSNQEFYDNRLIIKTDLSQRGIRKKFLNQFGGMYWLKAEGQAEYPHGGSLYNQGELACIQQLLPLLMDQLAKHNLEHASVGIVTPYREQEERIQKWIDHQFGNNGRITAGTAHKYQGDEKDFMIFSPVLARGINEGSLGWLQRTRNLLNVAITRARISLVIAGDWNFCMSLKEDHSFRHLAEYVGQQPGRILNDVKDLPLNSKRPMDIVGIVTDSHNPEYNRTTLRRYLSSCVEYVWWMDPYFQDEIFDLWRDIFQDPKVGIREVRLLTAEQQTEPKNYKPPELRLGKYERFRTELKTRGIQLEMRLIDIRDLPHDRLLYSLGQAINMPPFNAAYGNHRRVSEYTRSGTKRDLFLEYFDKAKLVKTTDS